MAMLQMLHAASNGGCRLVIGRRLPGGGMYVVLDLGRADAKQASSSGSGAEPQVQISATSTVKAPSRSASMPEAAQRAQQRQAPLAGVEYASVPLRKGLDTVILGSVGLWCATLPFSNFHAQASFTACTGWGCFALYDFSVCMTCHWS